MYVDVVSQHVCYARSSWIWVPVSFDSGRDFLEEFYMLYLATKY